MSVEHPELERGLSRRATECVVALVLIGLACAALWDNYSRGAGWQGGPQSGFFPARIAWLLLAASVVVFINGWRREEETLVTWTQLAQVMKVFLPLIIYVFAIGYVGIYVASGLLIASFMTAFGSFRWWNPILAAVIIPVATFWIFEMQFQVPLPKGPLEAWLGY